MHPVELIVRGLSYFLILWGAGMMCRAVVSAYRQTIRQAHQRGFDEAAQMLGDLQKLAGGSLDALPGDPSEDVRTGGGK